MLVKSVQVGLSRRDSSATVAESPRGQGRTPPPRLTGHCGRVTPQARADPSTEAHWGPLKAAPKRAPKYSPFPSPSS
eukprot:12818867-Alexandrium_andersonii.AAC.1